MPQEAFAQPKSDDKDAAAKKRRAYKELYKRAVQLYKAKEYSEAKKLFQQLKDEKADLGLIDNWNLNRYLNRIDSDIAKYKDEKRRIEEKQKQLHDFYTEGKKLYENGNYEEAKDRLLKAKSLAKQIQTDEQTRADIQTYLKKIEEKVAEQKRIAKEKDYQEKRAAEAKRRKILEKYEKAKGLYNQNRFDEAKTLFQEVANSNVKLGFLKNLQLKNYLSQIEKNVGRQKEKKQKELQERKTREQKQTEEKKRREVRAKYGNAVSLYKQKNYTEAKRLFEEIKPDESYLNFFQRNVDDYLAKIDSDIKRQEIEKTRLQRAKDEQEKIFDSAEKLFKDGSYKKAKELFGKVKSSNISLGKEKDRLLALYLQRVDEKIKEKEKQEKRAREEKKRVAAEKRKQLIAKYEQAKALYKEKNFIEAKKIFLELSKSKADLGFFRNMGLKNYLSEIDGDIVKQEQEKKNAERLLKRQKDNFVQAEKLFNEGKYEEARKLFIGIKSSKVDLGKEKNEALKTHLAEAEAKIKERKSLEQRQAEEKKRIAAEKRKQLIAKYEQAKALYKEKNFIEAKKIFLELSKSKADLGFFRNMGLKNYLSEIDGDIVRQEQEKKNAEQLLKRQKDNFVQAEKLFNEGKYEEARKLFIGIKSSKVDLGKEKNEALKTHLAKAEAKIKEREKKEKEVLKAQRVAAEERRIKVVELFKKAERLYKNRKFAESEKIFQKISSGGVKMGFPYDWMLSDYLKKIPQDIAEQQKRHEEAQTLLNEGKKLFDKGEYSKAKSRFDKAKINEIYLTAEEKNQLGKYLEDAAAKIKEIHEREQRELKAKRNETIKKYGEAVSLYNQKRYEDAKKIFQEIAGSGIDIGILRSWRLKRYLSRIDKDIENQKIEQKELENKRKELQSIFAEGKRAFKEGRYDEAKTLFEKANAKRSIFDKETAKALENYLAQVDKKIEENEQLKAQKKEKYRSNFELAVSLYNEKKYTKAKEIFQKLAQDATNLDPYISRKANRYLKRVNECIERKKQREDEAQKILERIRKNYKIAKQKEAEGKDAYDIYEQLSKDVEILEEKYRDTDTYIQNYK